ncbi:chorismate mutase [Allomyces macrogynus ATCC 38327]|uniref:Bifunctional chorismate mutase/prephenate dehydratase n=1 Tax=Allomyces macrogynus (strain ATCC 38327) TaxID=578462 RepID=A0A0L0TAC9_ALLM3|nr:chorismate mutase [Allomyces macrogynus ATCC 38327]|eukprot:KNE71479.1 chorismate mutase [Allomyces macrogynus ATCC 38327]
MDDRRHRDRPFTPPGIAATPTASARTAAAPPAGQPQPPSTAVAGIMDHHDQPMATDAPPAPDADANASSSAAPLTSDLADLRKKIDSVDAQLVHLLNQRATISVQVGKVKQLASESSGTAPSAPSASSSDVYVPRREREVFEKVVRLNHGPLAHEAVVAIYREIMSASISLQQQVAVAFLGPAGTHTHQAALDRFGDSVLFVPISTIAEVFTAVEQGRATYGLVPLENSTFGSVAQSLDRFMTTTLQIRAESYLPIHHHLMSNSTLHTIRRVYSHPEAFGQCQKFLDTHLPDAARINVASTAHAAELAAKEPYAAAICNADAAGNTTRFVVIARGQGDATPSGNDATLLCFTVDHRAPGALCDALKVFKDCGINLTRIDSRPDRLRNARAGLWHYVWFVELEGHRVDAKVVRAVEGLTASCLDVKVLGSYPKVPTPTPTA